MVLRCILNLNFQGREEREQCFKPILDEVKTQFKDSVDKETGERVKVLIPGSGMGRLVFEFALEGFAT